MTDISSLEGSHKQVDTASANDDSAHMLTMLEQLQLKVEQQQELLQQGITILELLHDQSNPLQAPSLEQAPDAMVTWGRPRGKCEMSNDGKGIGGLLFDGYCSSFEALI